jgi:AP2-associated kinase
VASPPMVGIQKVDPIQPAQPSIPDITPMRRGRPTQAQSHLQPVSAKVTPAGSRGTSSDPFAALDSGSAAARSAAVDELASRFPSLDEFSLLHDRGNKFEFGQTVPSADPKQETISKRVTEALADEVFAQSNTPPTQSKSATPALDRALPTREIKRTEMQPPIAVRSQPTLAQPTPQRPSMVSTGIQTSPPPSPSPPKHTDFSQRTWRAPQGKPDHLYNSNQTLSRQASSPFEAELPPRPEKTSSRPGILERHRTKSQSHTLAVPQSPASSRPSLESSRPPALDLSESISRSKSANARPRPASVYVESNMDYLRNRETPPSKMATSNKTGGWLPKSDVRTSTSAVEEDSSSDEEGPEDPIASNVGFLRAMETDNTKQKKSRRSSSGGKSKRTSLPSISLSGTKNILAGRFGDAFRRFETNSSTQPARVPSPDIDHDLLRNQTLTPIAGSERTGTSGNSEDEMGLDETQDLSPEVRRELERRRLSQEEKRVADAAAEYRQRLAQGDRGGAGPSKGSAIQNRVKSLLDGQKEAPPTRTAEGYGRFTPAVKTGERPIVARKPVAISTSSNPGYDKSRAAAHPAIASLTGMVSPGITSSAPAAVNRTGPRPNVAPKPKAFRTGGPGPEGTASPTQQQDEDWESNFAKKYPALGLEMVEAEIRPSMRVKDI